MKSAGSQKAARETTPREPPAMERSQSQHAGRGMSLAAHPGKACGTEVPTSATARDQKLFPVAGKRMGISSRITPSPPSTCTPLTPACRHNFPNSFRPSSMAGSKLLRKWDRRWHSRNQTPENVFPNPPENSATCPSLGAVHYFQHFIASFGLQNMKSVARCLTPLCCSLTYCAGIEHQQLLTGVISKQADWLGRAQEQEAVAVALSPSSSSQKKNFGFWGCLLCAHAGAGGTFVSALTSAYSPSCFLGAGCCWGAASPMHYKVVLL